MPLGGCVQALDRRFAAALTRRFSEALTRRFFEALTRLGPFGETPRLAVAASGGADSTALALLARDFCAARGGTLQAYIVDHGLREGSAAEAELTARRLDERGIGSRILTLSGLPRGAKLQEAAREARYAALSDAAHADGVLHLLLGHHQADQEETVAMRGLRGPGGAEGICSWSARNKILLLRPLLGERPETLRAYLHTKEMGWAEDPSNQSRRFERVRWRQDGAGGQASGADARVAREQGIAAFLAAHACLQPEGFAVLDAGQAPPEALGALIRTIGGAKYPPRQAALARLAANLRPATLGGVRILPAGKWGPGWLLAREPAACAPQVPAMPGTLWDGRFTLIAAPGPGQTLGALLGALGAEAAKYRKFRNLPGIVLRGMAALRDADGNVSFPAPVRFAPAQPATSHPFIV